MKVRTIVRGMGFFVVSVFVLFPIFWGVRTSLAPRYDTNLIPAKIVFENYKHLFVRSFFLRSILNSIAVSLGTITITLPLVLLAAYALARLRFPGKRFGILFLVLPLLPPIAILVPLVTYMNRLGLYNNLFAVILTHSVFIMPFTVWMLRNFFLTIPVAVEESAMLDGCSRLGVICRISIPMAFPGLIAVVVFIFISTWITYLFPYAFISYQELKTLPQTVLSFVGQWGTDYGKLNAAAMIALVPPLVVFVIFQKWFVAGLFGSQFK